MTKQGLVIQIELLVFFCVLIASCTSSNNSSLSTPPQAKTLPPSWTPTPATLSTSVPSSTPTHDIGFDLPTQWPFPTLTRDQLQAANKCPSMAEQSSGNSTLTPFNDLSLTDNPSDTCSLTHHAYQLLVASGYSENLPVEGIEDFRRIVEVNPAFMFHNDLFYGYFGAIEISELPPVAKQPIASVDIHYTWGGLGSDPIEYFITITDVQSQPQIEITNIEGQAPSNPIIQVETSDVQTLALSLTDFVPIPQYSTLVTCTDNYPDWDVEIVFTDGSTISLVTEGSNILWFGGPWQTTIDGSAYMQLSSDFAFALGQLITTMEMPLGQPAAMFCFQEPIIQTVFGIDS